MLMSVDVLLSWWIVIVPVLEMLKSVVVALAVEEETTKTLLPGKTAPLLAESARRPKGVDVPMPIAPLVGSWNFVDVAGRVPKRRPPILSWLFVSDWKCVLLPIPMFFPPFTRSFLHDAPRRMLP